MKTNKIIIFLTILISVACNNKSSEIEKEENFEIQKELNETSFEPTANATLDNWLAYYKNNVDSTFTTDKFNLTYESKFSRIQGNVFGVFDDGFDKTYTDFLIYSPDKQNYIDIDGYRWSADKENKTEISFGVDQEINLINIPNKKIERIGFRGSIGWVEDAYWKNDSIIVLLETTTDKVPEITEVNIYSNSSATYTYQDTLKIMSDYSRKRILEKLNN